MTKIKEMKMMETVIQIEVGWSQKSTNETGKNFIAFLNSSLPTTAQLHVTQYREEFLPCLFPVYLTLLDKGHFCTSDA